MPRRATISFILAHVSTFFSVGVVAQIRVYFVVSCSSNNLVSCSRDMGVDVRLTGMMRCRRRRFCMSCVSCVAVRARV